MIDADTFAIELMSTPECLWRYARHGGTALAFAPPVFEVDGTAAVAHLDAPPALEGPTILAHRVHEYRCRGRLASDASLSLEITFQVSPGSPVVRFRYALHSTGARRLTKTGGSDALTYLTTSLAGLPDATEVRFSEFNERVHSFCLAERPVEARQFAQSLAVMGPLLWAQNAEEAFLLAYEHGSQVPDAFVQFALSPGREVALRAVKGSYADGQILDAQHPYETLWLEVAGVAGGEDALTQAYRAFVLRGMTPNAESRRPYIFYNTWNFQERSRWWYHEPYLGPMRQERMLAEIDVAHRMGIDVFVLDTGWYEKTGDWRVNRERFPDGLQAIKAKLDGYGMKLGLWFDPLAAAVSSRMLQSHTDCILSWNDKTGDPHPIWETEDSRKLCLVSRYADAFAQELIRLVREVGVTYFKWDAIGQYGCNDPGHHHGTEDNTPQERADCYAFALGGAMSRIVDTLCAACPEAIVDFDITEGGRSVGLGFLASGKYFLINNGPYSGNYDLQPPADGNVNLFFWPGPARAWICRTPLTLDKWVPSVLFLTHYLPDDPASSQWINVASLMLGQNGIWGDLLRVSEEGVARIGSVLRRYKDVRDDITAATLIRSGDVGGSPEVYEKINPETGRGVVCAFASAKGHYVYLTRQPVDANFWHTEGVTVSHDSDGFARLEMEFTGAGAHIALFGVSGE